MKRRCFADDQITSITACSFVRKVIRIQRRSENMAATCNSDMENAALFAVLHQCGLDRYFEKLKGKNLLLYSLLISLFNILSMTCG